MKIRAAINGYGRIGRCILRALHEKSYCNKIQVVAINERAPIESIVHLTKYDTTHGRFPKPIGYDADSIVVEGESIRILSKSNIEELPWSDLDVDVVMECTGCYTTRKEGEKHLEAGAKKVVFSHPAEGDVDATIVYGVNDETLTSRDQIISNASCTTNSVIPVLKIIDDHLGIDNGLITTIHSMMNDQPVIDAYHHEDLRRTRCAGQSVIPVKTELSKGIGRILPGLKGRFETIALRVPVVNVSAMDISVWVRKKTDVQAVNHLLRENAENGYSGILGYTEEPLASCDFNHDDRSSIVDGSQTRVAENTALKLIAWFDNEWAYANRMLDTALALMQAS